MKKTTKSAFHRGFTLIELMIVIVILGILMGTILPRLTGAQARARDTGRIADLNTIGQALETFFDDNGQYPGETDTIYCLYTGDDIVETDTGEPGTEILEDISGYLKGGVVPTPSASQRTRFGAAADAICTGSYVYMPLDSRGIPNNGYALITDVETFQKANVLASSLDGLADTSALGVILEGTSTDEIEEKDLGLNETAADALDTVYVVYN